MAKTMKNMDGITVAQIQDKKLSKTIIGSRHLLRNPPAIAFDLHIINEAMQSGVEEITVWDEEAEIRYQTNMDNFFAIQIVRQSRTWSAIRPANTSLVGSSR